MGIIKTLDKSSILRLAAGEIIERPVSIVKELIENSIDANSTQIFVTLQQGGIDEIIIADNGDGILNDDIEKTIIPHATSKLTTFDDLQSILTMGFRGEALASITEVANLRIHSYNQSDKIGVELSKKATSESINVENKAREAGTTIQVSHLFKHIPVRYRFLKSANSEANTICKCMQQFSLHYPNISFRLINNGNELLNTTGSGDLLSQFRQVLQLKESFQLIPFQKTTDQINISGVILEPTVTYKNRSKCWFSVNKRMVHAAVFFKAVQQALVDIIPKQTFPAIVCNIECPTEDVDINMHPKKEEVKFAYSDQIFIAIKRAVQSGVHQKAAAWQESQTHMNATAFDMNIIPKSESNMGMSDKQSELSFLNNSAEPILSENNKPYGISFSEASQPVKEDASSLENNFRPQAEIRSARYEERKVSITQEPLMKTEETLKWVTFKNKFILLPLKDDVFIFDQHAVHERVLYDEFKEQQQTKSIIMMPLLVPEYIKCSSTEHELVKDLIPDLQKIGIDISVFDNELYVIREIPQCFQKINLNEWILDLVNNSNPEEQLNSQPDGVVQQLQLKACKAAIKAGQRLTDKEITTLIQKCVDSEIQFTCPHGRPLYIKLSENKLDSLFLRS